MKQKRKEKPKAEDSQKVNQKEIETEKSELEELRNTIESLQKEKDELFAQLQRVSADYANFQKRAPKQIADTISYEREKIIKTLLPVLDNFESALGGLQNADLADNVDVLVKGIEIIYNQMLDILKLHGVEQIKALDEEFDPALHQAMMQKAEPDKEDNIVLEEFQKGYKLNGRVIRPSKVIVNKLTSEQPADQQEVAPPEQTIDEFETTDME